MATRAVVCRSRGQVHWVRLGWTLVSINSNGSGVGHEGRPWTALRSRGRPLRGSRRWRGSCNSRRLKSRYRRPSRLHRSRAAGVVRSSRPARSSRSSRSGSPRRLRPGRQRPAQIVGMATRQPEAAALEARRGASLRNSRRWTATFRPLRNAEFASCCANPQSQRSGPDHQSPGRGVLDRHDVTRGRVANIIPRRAVERRRQWTLPDRRDVRKPAGGLHLARLKSLAELEPPTGAAAFRRARTSKPGFDLPRRDGVTWRQVLSPLYAPAPSWPIPGGAAVAASKRTAEAWMPGHHRPVSERKSNRVVYPTLRFRIGT